MKKKTKKLNIKKFIIFLFIIILIIYFCNRNKEYSSDNPDFDFSNAGDSSVYKVIKLDENKNYSGIGKEKIKIKDGNFTTFTTVDKYQKTYKEYKQNGNSSWSNHEYWGGTMAENGCGIAVLSVILSGYNKNYTPEDLRKKYFPVIDYSQLSDELSSKFKIKNSDFYYDSAHLSNQKIQEHLKTNRPIIICVWNKPTDNRWTTSSHYMALLAADDNGLVYVSNPNRWRK